MPVGNTGHAKPFCPAVLTTLCRAPKMYAKACIQTATCSTGRQACSDAVLRIIGRRMVSTCSVLEVSRRTQADLSSPRPPTVYGLALEFRWCSTIIGIFVHRRVDEDGAAIVHGAGSAGVIDYLFQTQATCPFRCRSRMSRREVGTACSTAAKWVVCRDGRHASGGRECREIASSNNLGLTSAIRPRSGADSRIERTMAAGQYWPSNVVRATCWA